MRIGTVLIGCLLAFSTNIQAQTPTDATLPAALKDWRAWVLHDLDYRACPFLATRVPNTAGDFVCTWPGTLHLDAEANGVPEGVVVRSPDRSRIAKIRREDYERTLKWRRTDR